MSILKKEYHGINKISIISAFCFIFILPLIIANVPYMDDNTRMDNGVGYWEIEGRPITTLLFKILNFSIYDIANIAPLPLIVGVIFVIFSINYATDKMSAKKTLFNIIPFVFIICNPFFMQNMSYQFDSVGHLFSVGFIVFSLFYQNDKNKYKKHIIPIIFIVLACGSYQPTSNLYIALYCVIFLFDLNKITNENATQNITRYFLYYIIGCIVYYSLYYIGFSYFFTEISNRNHMISINELFLSYQISFSEFLNLFLLLDYGLTGILIKTSLFLIIINVFIKVYFIHKNESNTMDKIIKISFTLLIPIILFLSLWGPFILLKELFFNPRDFPSVGAFFMAFCFSFIYMDYKNIFKTINLCLISIYMIGFSFMYGNALHYDNNYKQYVYDSIARDIEIHLNEIKDRKIQVYGQNATSSYIYHATQINPFIRILVFPENTNFVKKYNLSARNIYNVIGGVIDDDYNEWTNICKNKIKPLVENRNYDLFLFEDHLSVWFKNNPSLCSSIPTDTNSKFYDKNAIIENKKMN